VAKADQVASGSHRLPSGVPRSSRRSRFNLVDFERPPVVEVILAVQFPADTVDLEAYGRFAQQIREELPRRTSQPLVPPVEETFDKPAARSSLEIRLEGPTALPRIVFESENGVELVQLQPHRLTLNWRGRDADAPYPRYELLRRRFRQLLKRLTAALDEVGQPHPINLSQVTYVNPIEYPGAGTSDGVGTTHPDLAKIINRLRPRPRDAFLPEAEDAQLQARWRIPPEALGRTGSPAGRLHLSVAPGLKPPGETPIYLVNLTAHVMPRGGSVDKAMDALDVGHKWVVLGFKDLTTSEMHKHWGLRE
jgi:uncharacterized protein (TIGR04255 family)